MENKKEEQIRWTKRRFASFHVCVSMSRNEVLPSIHRYGAYITDETLRKIREKEVFSDNLISRFADAKMKNAAPLGKVERLVPKARYCDIILQCANAVQTSIIAKDYGMTCTAFNKLLHGLKIQCKIGET